MNKEHRWRFCPVCHCAMVVCGYCGNNCCNGGSGESCPDRCASAYDMQDKGWEDKTLIPPEILAKEENDVP
jgi:hypothetical protein